MSALPTIGKMLRNWDRTVALHCTFAVGRGAAIVAERPVARAAMHGGLIFAHTMWTRKRSTCCCGWKQLERDCIFKQFVRGLGAHLCAARACKCTIRTRTCQLLRTPTAGLVKAWVNLHSRRGRDKGDVREWRERTENRLRVGVQSQQTQSRSTAVDTYHWPPLARLPLVRLLAVDARCTSRDCLHNSK